MTDDPVQPKRAEAIPSVRGPLLALVLVLTVLIGGWKGCAYINGSSLRRISGEPILQGVPGWKVVFEDHAKNTNFADGKASITKRWETSSAPRRAMRDLIDRYQPTYGKPSSVSLDLLLLHVGWSTGLRKAEIDVTFNKRPNGSSVSMSIND